MSDKLDERVSIGASLPPGWESDISFRLRKPTAVDARHIYELINDCPPLDVNSLYCNLLQCSHFADYCVLAEKDGELAAFLSAYCKPSEPETLFVWQIAVARPYRGLGLANRMLDELLRRPVAHQVNYLETTITPSNRSSAALFARFAQKHAARLTKTLLFSKSDHFAGTHEDEVLFRIGPFPPPDQTPGASR